MDRAGIIEKYDSLSNEQKELFIKVISVMRDRDLIDSKISEYENMLISTVGDLRNALKKYPDNKPIIVNVDGNTYPVSIVDWYDPSSSIGPDTDWPISIDASF